jgi:nitrate reductase NapE component
LLRKGQLSALDICILTSPVHITNIACSVIIHHNVWKCKKVVSTDEILMNRICSNPTMVGALAGSLLCRKAAANAFAQHKRSTVTGNIIECLGHRLTLICSSSVFLYSKQVLQRLAHAKVETSVWELISFALFECLLTRAFLGGYFAVWMNSSHCDYPAHSQMYAGQECEHSVWSPLLNGLSSSEYTASNRIQYIQLHLF